MYELTHLLRRECPWDRAQTAGTIVPHTLEETYEVADVVRGLEAGEHDDLHALEDELGDLLFQICFLAMWCHEHDSAIDLGSVARAINAKLVRRHPHVFGGDVQAATADDVRETWEHIKRDAEQRGLFDGIPPSMPALFQARKVQQRAGSIGFDFADARAALDKLEEELGELREALDAAAAAGRLPVGETAPPDPHVEHEVGDVLFAAVNVARLVRSDPELALRDTTTRWRGRVEGAIDAAAREQVDFASLSLNDQERYYQRAKSAQ